MSDEPRPDPAPQVTAAFGALVSALQAAAVADDADFDLIAGHLAKVRELRERWRAGEDAPAVRAPRPAPKPAKSKPGKSSETA